MDVMKRSVVWCLWLASLLFCDLYVQANDQSIRERSAIRRDVFRRLLEALNSHQGNDINTPDYVHQLADERSLGKDKAENKMTEKMQKEVDKVQGKMKEIVVGHTRNGLRSINDETQDPNSEMERLKESFIDIQNGFPVVHTDTNPAETAKTKGDSEDGHRYTQEQENLRRELQSKGLPITQRGFNVNSRLWEQGIVPYEISDKFDDAAKQVILKGIEEFHQKTCLKIVSRGDPLAQKLPHQTYIQFVNEDGCWSYVGRTNQSPQDLGLGPGCYSVSTVVHELCHALGMEHEQSRSDRDNHVYMFWNKISGGTNNGNMAKEKTIDVHSPYDQESVLQYSLYAFSIDGSKVMSFKDPRLDFLADSATGLMFYDVKDITNVYKCTENCASKPNCQNGGYLNFKCQCYCPAHLTGPTCETIITDAGCGGVVDVSTGTKIIQSENYPNNYNSGKECTWLVKGSSDKLIRLVVEDLSITAASGGSCGHWLEIRYNLIGQTGPRRCGTSNVQERYITTPEGEHNLMLLAFNTTKAGVASSKGFKLRVEEVGMGCRGEPCQFGTCTSTSSSTYSCQCHSGFTGQNCDVVKVDTSLSCDFETHGCFLENIPSDKFDWSISQGKSSPNDTGNYHGVLQTYGTAGDKAVLSSKMKFEAGQRCFRMKALLYGQNPGTLKLRSGTITFFTLSKDEGGWIDIAKDVELTLGSELSLEATVTNEGTINMAVDVITITPGSCHGAPNTQTTSTAAPITAAPTTKAPTTAAPTTKAPTTAAPTTKAPSTAAPTTKAPSTAAPTTKAPSTAAPTTKAPTTAAPTTKAPSTAAPTTKAPNPVNPESTSGVEIASCSVEQGEDCFLHQVTGQDDLDWSINSKPNTPTRGTGPNKPYQGQQYFYLESSRNNEGEFAMLRSDEMTAGKYCLSFAYHMYGKSMGDLFISTYGVSSGNFEVVFWKSGNIDQSWRKAHVDMDFSEQFVIAVFGFRGSSKRSDMAIDDIKLISGPCAGKEGELFSCGFESDDDPSCILTQDQFNDDFDWTRHEGPTPSRRTGPQSAYEGTYYLYMEASRKQSNQTADLRADLGYTEKGSCLQFGYHMKGSGMGKLSVLSGNLNQEAERWAKSGDQSYAWHEARVNIPAEDDLVIIIRATRGTTWKSDIAIDNVSLLDGLC